MSNFQSLFKILDNDLYLQPSTNGNTIDFSSYGYSAIANTDTTDISYNTFNATSNGLYTYNNNDIFVLNDCTAVYDIYTSTPSSPIIPDITKYKYCRIIMIGGGGGGGGGGATGGEYGSNSKGCGGGGGGGSGGNIITNAIELTSDSSGNANNITITIGNGGAKGNGGAYYTNYSFPAAGSNGKSGGTTQVIYDTYTLNASGGEGGEGGGKSASSKVGYQGGGGGGGAISYDSSMPSFWSSTYSIIGNSGSGDNTIRTTENGIGAANNLDNYILTSLRDIYGKGGDGGDGGTGSTTIGADGIGGTKGVVIIVWLTASLDIESK